MKEGNYKICFTKIYFLLIIKLLKIQIVILS